MSICGIIAEFNPFHHGHAYLLSQAKQSPNDIIIVVMSGSFVQRGEIAICDKWTRAQWALDGGADLVIELPVVYSLQSASYFARGAIQLLNHIGCQKIFFGSEQNNLQDFMLLSEQCRDTSWHSKSNLTTYMRIGMTYPQAFYQLYLDTYGQTPQSAILKQPNATLGLSYIQAIQEINPRMDIHIISRKGASYHDERTNILNPSATAIRQAIYNSKTDEAIATSLPSYVDIQKDSIAYMEQLYPLILYRLRILESNELQKLFGVAQGLESRLKSIPHSDTYASFVSNLKTKQYTQLYIQRMLSSILLDISKQTITQANSSSIIPMHVLGFRSSATKHLKQLQEKSYPIWMNKKDYQLLSPDTQFISSFDIRATDIQALAFRSPEKQTAQQDFTHMLCCY